MKPPRCLREPTDVAMATSSANTVPQAAAHLVRYEIGWAGQEEPRRGAVNGVSGQRTTLIMPC
jgi:hypothetical protein